MGTIHEWDVNQHTSDHSVLEPSLFQVLETNKTLAL